MAERHPTTVLNITDGIDFDDSPLMIGGDRLNAVDPAPYSNRLQLYAKRDATGYLDAYLRDELGLITRLTNKGSNPLALPLNLIATPGSTVAIETKVTGDAAQRLTITVDGTHSWGDGTNPADLILVRDGVGTAALKNGAVAQTLKIYGNATGPRYLVVAHTGAQGRVFTADAASLFFGANGGLQWNIDSTTGHWFATNDNANDIGASGATRPRNIYFGTRSLAPDGTANNPSYGFANNLDLGMYSIAGVLAFAQAGTLAMYIDSAASHILVPANLSVGAVDCSLLRRGAGILSLENAGSAQTFRVYGTTAGAKYTALSHDGTNSKLDGTTGSLLLGGNLNVFISTGAGIFYQTDNATDFGSPGAGSARDLAGVELRVCPCPGRGAA